MAKEYSTGPSFQFFISHKWEFRPDGFKTIHVGEDGPGWVSVQFENAAQKVWASEEEKRDELFNSLRNVRGAFDNYEMENPNINLGWRGHLRHLFGYNCVLMSTYGGHFAPWDYYEPYLERVKKYSREENNLYFVRYWLDQAVLWRGANIWCHIVDYLKETTKEKDQKIEAIANKAVQDFQEQFR